MAMLTVDCVTINAVNPSALAQFWAALVGGTPQDAGNSFVLVKPGDGRIPLLFQRSDAPDARLGWVHLDCSVEDKDTAIEEIVRLGGQLVEHRSDSNGSWTVMADPEGNPFCI